MAMFPFSVQNIPVMGRLFINPIRGIIEIL